MKQTMVIFSTFLVFGVFLGCGDDSKTQKQHQTAKQNVEPKIEIIQNKNAHEVKVKVKKKDKDQSQSYYYDYGEKAEYSQDAQPANEDASVRIRPRTAIDANMNIRSPYENVQVSLLVSKLSKKFIVKCSACHNDYANGIIGPSLLGRDADYIYNKIADFKSGKKSNPLMNDLIKMMSDDEIRAMAEEVYKFNKEIKKMRMK